MGFIGKFIKTIFSPSVPQVDTSTLNSVTGRDLVEQTTSQEPEAPVMGGDDKDKKKRGVQSLLVPSNNLYKGGIS